MVLGRGTIAGIIPDRENFIFFACGESNRTELTYAKRRSEAEKILSWQGTDKMFVYFSGLNIYYPDGGRGEYTQHKLDMECIVRSTFQNYCIFRLGSVTWGDNPNTIINFIKNELKQKGTCEAKPVYRYLHTKHELNHWLTMIPEKGKHEMNVTGQLTWVPDLVEMIKRNEI